MGYLLSIKKGVTFRAVFIAKGADGTPLDLTGWSVASHVRLRSGGPLILDLAPQITDAAAGEVTCEFSGAETAAFDAPAGSYVTDLIFTAPSGDSFADGPGQVQISQTVTSP